MYIPEENKKPVILEMFLLKKILDIEKKHGEKKI
jgi:hypothetical protein